jgi:hypothetical protein
MADTAPSVRTIDAEPPEPIDLFEVAGPAVARRALIPAAVATAVLAVLLIAFRRGR